MKLASHPRFWLICSLLVTDSLVFNLTNPGNVSSFMLIAGFLLCIITVYYLVFGVLSLGNWYGLSLGKRPQRLARTTTGLVGGLVALQSIGELSFRDVLVLLPLAVLAYLYISYGKASQHASA